MNAWLKNWDNYQFVCELIERKRLEYEFRYGDNPKAICVTSGLLSFLACGPDLIRHADGTHTFHGIPTQFCSGPGLAFHFAGDVFAIDVEDRT